MKLRPNHFLRWFVALVAIFSCNFLLAQRTITGSVTDAQNNEPLIGANILVVGTSIGTITEIDGSYSLEVPAGATELEFSYTGYASRRMTIGTSNVMDVALSAGQVLDEVVVIGYGTTRKSDATGAVNAISSKDFNRGAIVSPDQLITGKVAGVQITSNSGEPGGQTSVRIRGGTSVNASNEPLYVIDGVPIDNAPHNPGGFSGGRNPLNFLNPNDIETFTVLKDASATAIYGSRGANGVILITTKKGKAGERSRVTYDGYYTTAQLANEPDVFNATDFRNVVTFKAPSRLENLGSNTTNWFDEVTQTASGHSHNVSFTGGADKMGYRLSAGYQTLDGVIRASKTERTNFSLNYNHTLLNDRLSINANVKGSFTKDQYDPGVVSGATTFDPTQQVYDPTNTLFGGYFEYALAQSPRNPVSFIEQQQDFGKSFRNIGNIELGYKLDDLISGLSAKLNLGYDINNGERKRFQPTTLNRSPFTNYTGEIRIENFTRTNTLLDFYLNYNKTFGENHRVDFVAGYSYQDFASEYPSFRAYDLANDIFGFNSTTPAAFFEANNSVVENRLISFFGRANYSFNDKYLLTVTVRRDGSTRFGEANRWGTFPSAAFAWRILEEGFAESLTHTFSDLKIRLGYGVTGNQDIGDFRYLPTYSLSDARARYQFGETFVTTARPNGYDPNLKWEETSSYNLGVDFGFLRGRINGSLDYYYKETNDLLFTVNVPAGTNLTDRVLTNIGSVENQGVELTLNAFVIDKGDFSWNVSFNAARNTNKILSIDQVSTAGILTGGIAGGVGNNVQILQVGQPINAFYVFQQINGADGNPLPDGVDHNEDGVINQADIYQDTNNDGKVDDFDKRPLEKPAPDIILGLGSQLTFKNFDLNFTLRGNIGNYIYNNNASVAGYYDRIDERPGFVNNIHTSVLVTNFERPQYFSDFYIEEASFLRLDNVTLGYTFNPSANNRSLRLYATAQNVFVATKYTGLDPEVGNGIDNNPYPRSRAFIFGLSLGL